MTVNGVIGVSMGVIGLVLFGCGCYLERESKTADKFADFLMKTEEELCRKCAVWIHSVEETDEEE